MRDVLLNIKTDHNTKEHLKSFAEELGISMTAFINMLVKHVLRERRVVLNTTLEPTPYLEKIMREADYDYNHDHNITHIKSAIEAIVHLDGLMKR